MSQLLPRGFCVSSENRIKKLIADGDTWQIYSTNTDTFVLAVKPALYNRWVSDYSLPTGIFLENLYPSCQVFLSSGNYIVSSMQKGPYPQNYGQVEAFSIAFKTAIDIFPEVDIHDAIYIEKYSLLLPTSFNNAIVDNAVVYGKWLTGGINISIESIKRVSQIMSWLPEKSIIKSARTAGFDIPSLPSEKIVNKNDMKPIEEVTNPIDPNQSNSIGVEGQFSLIGRPHLEQFFNENIIDIVLHQDKYKRMGISFPGATIICGPPGCGKTYAVEKLTEYLGWQRFNIDSNTIASPFIHDTSKKISEVFNSAISAAPSILVIDEMEAFLSDRAMGGQTRIYHVEEVAEFLRRIPEAISKGVLVFAMTNMIEAIDPAILRRGRFDHIVEVKMASAEEIEALLKIRFAELPVDEKVDAKAISSELAGHPISDVTFVLREAGRFAVKRNLELITNECFSNALHNLPKQKERSKIGFVQS